MPRKQETGLKWLGLSLLIIILDQTTKLLALHYVPFNKPIFITRFFNLILEHNPGAAFSFLSWGNGWQNWLLSITAFIVSIVIIYWLYKLPNNNKGLSLSLALILGGALGNLCDRIMHGYVIDFLDFHIKQYHWPVFNFADSAIVIGAIILIIRSFCAGSAEI